MKPTLRAEKPELPEYLNDILDAYEENDYESINCPSLDDVKQAVAQAIKDAVKAERVRILAEVKTWELVKGKDVFHPMAAKQLIGVIKSLSQTEGEATQKEE